MYIPCLVLTLYICFFIDIPSRITSFSFVGLFSCFISGLDNHKPFVRGWCTIWKHVRPWSPGCLKMKLLESTPTEWATKDQTLLEQEAKFLVLNNPFLLMTECSEVPIISASSDNLSSLLKTFWIPSYSMKTQHAALIFSGIAWGLWLAATNEVFRFSWSVKFTVLSSLNAIICSARIKRNFQLFR